MNRLNRFLDWFFSDRIDRIVRRILMSLVVLLFIGLLAKWNRC